MTRLTLALIAIASCANDVTVVLEPTQGCESACGVAPLGCLEHLRVTIWGEPTSGGEPAELASSCIDVPPSDTRTLCDLDLADAIDLALPGGTAGVEITGIGPGAKAGCNGPPIFAGSTAFTPAETTVRVPTRCVLSCSEYAAVHYELEVRDAFTGLKVSNTDDLQIEIGMLFDDRALHAPGGGGRTAFEAFAVDISRRTESGDVSFDGMAFELDQPDVCLAARVGPSESELPPSVSCLNKDEIESPLQLYLPGGALAAQLAPFIDAGVLYGRVLTDDAGARDVEVLVQASSSASKVLYSLDAPTSQAQATGSDGVFVVTGPFVGDVGVDGVEATTLGGTLPGHTSALHLFWPD